MKNPRLADRPATYEDVLRAPPHKVAELINGELVLSPRPSGPHAEATLSLGTELRQRFRRPPGDGGGWIILLEPELHVGRNVLVPDIAGWRRTTMATVPNAPHFTIRPDWICEVLSPSTERYDRGEKLGIYAEAGVGHAWLVNPIQRTLEVLRSEKAEIQSAWPWSLLGVFREDARVRAEPFEEFELELGTLWQDVERSES